MSPPNPYVKVLTPKVMVFGNGTFGAEIGLNEVMRVGPS